MIQTVPDNSCRKDEVLLPDPENPENQGINHHHHHHPVAGPSKEDDSSAQYTIPNHADFIMVFSTIPGGGRQKDDFIKAKGQ